MSSLFQYAILCACSFADQVYALTAWLQQPLDQRVFNKAVDQMLQQVVCPMIPETVRDILVDYRGLSRHSMFEQMFTYEVNGIDNWEGVVEAFITARNKYKEFLLNLTQGNNLSSNTKGPTYDNAMRWLSNT